MPSYYFQFTKQADRQFSKLDKPVQAQILDWIAANLDGTTQPRSHGKALQGKPRGLWRYRVGKYRLIAQIVDHDLVILGIAVAKRDEVYKCK